MYEVYLSTTLGDRLAVLSSFSSLSWTKALNDVGQMALAFSPEQIDHRLWSLDARVEIWRRSAAMRLVGIYYLRSQERATGSNGERMVVWRGEDANGLLDRRIIAYAAGTPQASKTTYADDLLKELVSENLGSLAGPMRNLTSLTVQPKQSLAPIVSKGCSRQRLLSALQAVCQSSRALGTRLYFEVCHPTLTTLEFRTYVHKMGVDRTDSGLTPFSLEQGTLAGPVRIAEDHRDEYNVVYAAGQGTEEDREVVTLSDTVAASRSAFARREALADGRAYSATSALTSYGREKLRQWAARFVFEGTLQDVPGAVYLEDWGFGDLLLVEYDHQTMKCEASVVQGTVTPDGEAITAKLESYD